MTTGYRAPGYLRAVKGLWQPLAMLAAVCVSLSPLLRSADEVTLALVPDGLTAEERAPLRNYLTQAIGRPVKLVVPDRYAETVQHLADGSYDFACLGALMYVRAHSQNGVVPLVQRSSDLQFHSVFVTGTNSGIHALSDLKGKRFAYGDVDSASGHLIPYREMSEAGIQASDLKSRYSGSHVVTAALVESGAVEAGALDEAVFHSLIDGGKLDRNKVRVFYTSKPFVDYVFVARKGISEAEREKFTQALLGLKEGENDAPLKVLRAKQFVAASDKEYDGIRKIAKELKLY
jgi:phosphonate transport system substrate-binding protein